ncbi:YtxH domain-containing protein [Flavobacterium sp. PL002]|uniref:YtxH domain-containing protein n=1 Tax=Flavobacterium sp. PL002 TaxID=1897058 RepID=UPI001787A4C8|nr:YtxH domain-containing protein [Flavobacterium sp. PL002]MBE0393315.1 hypothetical protein [Flavobacterium sp. PL002]
MKTNNTILGVLGGIAVGALLGILFAPDKGEKTRKKIKDKSTDYADDLSGKFNSAVDTISKKYDELKSETKSMYAEGKSQLEDTKKELEKETERLKAQV